jgi:pimeloyl-ACP methyl ester carboxylesterase
VADRTPLLLLHGALGSRAQLAPVAAALESRFAPYAFDFMGHGAAGLTGPLTMERLVEQAADYVRTHGLAPVPIVGYSMGGYVALQLAATQPELVRAVATLGTKLAWDPGVAVQVGARMNEETIAAKVPKLAAALQLEHTGIGWERLCRETRDMLATLGERPLLTRESFAGIAQPVRLMLGDRDDTVTLEETASVYHLLPAGQLEVLPRTGHPLVKVDVERLATSLTAFFGSAN